MRKLLRDLYRAEQEVAKARGTPTYEDASKEWDEARQLNERSYDLIWTLPEYKKYVKAQRALLARPAFNHYHALSKMADQARRVYNKALKTFAQALESKEKAKNLLLEVSPTVKDYFQSKDYYEKIKTAFQKGTTGQWQLDSAFDGKIYAKERALKVWEKEDSPAEEAKDAFEEAKLACEEAERECKEALRVKTQASNRMWEAYRKAIDATRSTMEAMALKEKEATWNKVLAIWNKVDQRLRAHAQ